MLVVPAATRDLRKLTAPIRARIGTQLRKEALRVANGSAGKSVKALHGRGDRFFRLRVGDYRVMHDAIEDEQALLVLGVVQRGDLDRWLRGR